MATELAKAYVQIIPSAKGIKGMLEKEMGGEASAAGKSAGKSLGDGILSRLAGIGKAAAAALSSATAAVGAFAGTSVKTGMAFDASMSQVAATMGKTIDEVGNLRDFAMDMGETTAFSATQAADALNYMALAGYDAEQSMAALPNVLNLAAAGGIDLAAASDMVTDAQSALGLSMEESAFLVDQMAMASSKSNTSVAQLGEAILTIGGTAKNLAGGTTELSTALGILADNGVKGAEGGTALRNIILSLSAPTDKAASALAEMGVQVYDATGNMRPLNETFGDLNEALSSMTQGEQTQVLNEIFNKVDLKSVNALLANTGERFDELSGYINNASGAAEQMAETQLDNLAGDVTLFQSALEGAQIVISDKLTPKLREFVQFGANGISKVSDAFKTDGHSGAMEALGGVLSDGLNMIIAQAPGFTNAGMQLLGALGQGLIANAPVILDSGLQIIAMLATSLISASPQMGQSALEIITMLANSLNNQLPSLIPVAMNAILQLAETLTNPDSLGNMVESALLLILSLADGLISALPSLLEKAPIIVGNLVTTIANNLPKILQVGIELLVKLGAGIISAIPQLVALTWQIITSFINGIKRFDTNVFNIGKDILNKVGDGLKSVISSAWTWGSDMMSGFIRGITSKLSSLWDTVTNAASGIAARIHFSRPDIGPLRDYESWMPDFMQGLARGIDSNAWRVEDAISGLAGTMQMDMDAALSPQLTVSRIAASAEPRQSAGESHGNVNIYIGDSQYRIEDIEDIPDWVIELISKKLKFLVDRRQAALGTA